MSQDLLSVSLPFIKILILNPLMADLSLTVYHEINVTNHSAVFDHMNASKTTIIKLASVAKMLP